MSFLHNITSIFPGAKRPALDDTLLETGPSLPAKPVTSKFVKPLLTVFLAMTGCSFLTFSSINGSFAQTTGTSTGPVAPASRRVTAALVTPTAAFAYYGTGTVHTNGRGHWANYAPEIRALARGLGAGRLSAEAYTTNVGKYVRDNIDTEFRFGLGKGARGALIDQSGTAFDQAELMVKLLRRGGVAASFQVGTITLTADQFGKWSGLVTNLNEGAQTFTVNANAACRFLADGGVPATVNGASSCTGLSGNLTTVTMAHVWVLANGKWYDPAYKAHKLYTGIDIPAAMGCGTTANNQCGDQVITAAMTGATTGTLGGADTVSGINSAAIETRLSAQALALQNSLEANKADAKLIEVVGGKDILTNGSFDSGIGLPYSLSNVSTFAGDVPDQYRTRLRIQFGTMDVTLWADETAGRQIQANPQTLPARVNSSFLAPPTAGLYLDGVTLATQPLAIAKSYTDAPSLPVESGIPGQITLTPLVPFPSAVMRTSFNVAQTFALMNKCCRDENGGFRRNAQILFLSGRQGPGYGESLVNRELTNMHCANACGNGGIYDIIASFLEQNAAAQALISRVSQSELAPHYLLGVANNDAAGRNWFNLITAFSATSVTSIAADETAVSRTFADTQAMLEGSTTQQQSDAQFMISPFSAGRTTAYTLIRPAAAATAVPLLSIDVASKQRVLDATGRGLTVVLPTLDPLGTFYPRGAYNSISYNPSQFTFGASAFSATIDWIYKGGGSATQIKPTRATEGTLQTRLMEKFGSETYDNGALKLNSTPDITVGSGQAALSFSRSYSSSDVLRQDVETSSRFEWVRGTYAPPPFGPREKTEELIYRGPDSSIKARVGGGWLHNFQGSATIANAGFKYLNPTIGVDAAIAIASLQASVDMARLETLASKIGSIHSLGWLAGKFMANSVSINGPAGSGTFVLQPSGALKNQSDRAATLTMTGSRVPVAICQMRNISATPSDYSSIRISVRSSDGTVSTFEPESSTTVTTTSCGPSNSITYSYSASPTFVLNKIVQPGGLVMTFAYEDRTVSQRVDSRASGIVSGIFGGDDPSAPTNEYQKSKILISVSTNLGNSLSFQYEYGPDESGGWESGNFGNLIYGRNTFRLTSVTASDGRLARFSWPNSNLLTVTRPDGSIIKYDYAPSAAGGDSPQATDPSYRPRYFLRRWYTPRDQATAVQSIKYDELGRVASVTTRNSKGDTSTENVYVGGVFSGENERRVDQINAAGGVNTDYYDSRGQAIRTIDEVGVAARYEYDGLGRVVTAFFEENAGASFKAGCMAAKGSRSNCWRTEYQYDARGNVTKETKYPYAWEGDYWWGHIEITEAAYSTDFNKPIWVRGPYSTDATEADKEAKKTSYEYNARGLLVKITQPVEYDRPAGATKAGVQEFEYDQYGRLLREKDASGRWTDTGYGENGQPIWCETSKTRSTQPGGLNLRSTATCTAAGDVATATDPKGNMTTFTYDAMRRKATETGPLGVQKRWIYDLDGNVEKEGAWDGAAWKDLVSTYSPTGKVLTQTDPAGDQVKFTYDVLDRILIKTDPEGRQVLTCYNAASQVLEEWRGKALTASQCGQAVSQASASTPQRYIKNQYGGPAGAITASFDPNNNQTTYAYQGLGKKITTNWPDGKFEHTLYNVTRSDGNVVITRDREGRWTNSHFDKLGRPWVNYSQETPDVFVGSKIQLNYYDSAGNLNWAGTWNHPDWRIQSSKEYDRDAAGRVYYERTYYSFPMDAAGNVTCWSCDASQVTYEYDANDNRTSMRWYHPDLSTIAKRADYSYDALNRMTGIAFGDWGGANQGSVNYQYDTLGRRTKVTRGNGTSTDYAYENDGDLDWMRHLFQGGASATSANGSWVGIDYAYDKSGRVTFTSATDSRIMGALPTVGTYGAANNLNQVANVPGRAAMTWSDAGNLKTDGKGTTFIHDGRNRLKRAVKSDGTTLDFLYTVEGYRVESIRNATGTTPAGLPSGGTRTRFLLSGSEEVADLDANRNFTRYFVPGPAIDERVAQIEANGAVTYMHTDRQASVVAITDAAGNVVSSRGYGSYGETDGAQLVGTGSHPFGYTGRRWDPDLGIYYYRARWYDPQTGTFLQTDPIGSLDYINLYAYVGLEPGNATDPTGLNRALVSLGKVVAKGIRSGNLKKAGVDEIAEIASDVSTLVDPNSSGLDKAEAVINLVSPVSTNDAKTGLDAVKNAVKGLRQGRSGKREGDFTRAQKNKAKRDNAAQNDGVMQCTDCQTPLENVSSKKGVPTPSNQAQVHHDPPISEGGGQDSKPIILCPGCHQQRHKK